MSKHLSWLQEEIQTLKDGGLYNEIRTISSPQGPWLVIAGKDVLNFCSNNYLGYRPTDRVIAEWADVWSFVLGNVQAR